MRRALTLANVFLCAMLLAAFLAGCAGHGESVPQPTNAPTESTAQATPAGTSPISTQPIQTDVSAPQIPEQNVLQSGDPKTLSEWVFTNYEETFSWRDGVNNFCSVSITLPAMAPVTDFAIRFNEEILELGSAYVAEVTECQQLAASNFLSRVTYEAYLHDDILSILLIEHTTIDYTVYRSWSFDMENGKELSTAALCDELLDMDYPSFILATNAITAHQFKAQYGEYIEGIENQPTVTDSYFETEPVEEVNLYHEIMEQIPYDTVNIENRQLFAGENGQIMLIYHAPSLAGADSYPTIIPFDLSNTDWQQPSEETAYGEFFRLTEYVDGAYADSYASMLLEAFFGNSEDFIEHAASATKERKSRIVHLLEYALYQPEDVERFQAECSDLLSNDDLTNAERELLNSLLETVAQ